MCGIAGKINFDKNHPLSVPELRRMGDVLKHRGPDDEGFYINGNVGFAFRRLSIIDLKSGHQPLSNEDGTIWIVFNGEIYNYKELKCSLQKQGHVFKTDCDTETIVHLYEQYGTDCLQHLRGMFSFAIWDDNKKSLFCARDRFGIKPFYYYSDNNQFVFGSEIKAILESENIDRSLSFEALDSYFTFGYITSDLSIYKSIHKLQPAHYLLLSFKEKESFKISRYWNINFQPDYSKSEKQWREEIEDCFSESVKLHMISDVPLGAFLSGGIDSSSVVAMMAKNSNRPIKTFSIGFKEEKFNELKFARQVANKFGCEHHEEIVEPKSIELLPKLVQAYDEPFGDPSAIPTYYVSKLAREHATVVLSGDGGDELFAGYDNYDKFNTLNSFPLFTNNSKFNTIFWGSLYKLIPEHIQGKGLTYYLSQNKKFVPAYISSSTKTERKRLFKLKHSIDHKITSELYKKSILQERADHDFVTNMQYLDLKTYMVDDVLTKVDRASMMNSLEVRVPLLDHKFAELTFKIPIGFKLKENSKKYIFKQAMKPFLPESILTHPKQGFSVPVSQWFKDDLKEYINDTLLSSSSCSSKYLDEKYVRKIINNSLKGYRDFGSKVWSLVFFEEWLKQNKL